MYRTHTKEQEKTVIFTCIYVCVYVFVEIIARMFAICLQKKNIFAKKQIISKSLKFKH